MKDDNNARDIRAINYSTHRWGWEPQSTLWRSSTTRPPDVLANVTSSTLSSRTVSPSQQTTPTLHHHLSSTSIHPVCPVPNVQKLYCINFEIPQRKYRTWVLLLFGSIDWINYELARVREREAGCADWLISQFNKTSCQSVADDKHAASMARTFVPAEARLAKPTSH